MSDERLLTLLLASSIGLGASVIFMKEPTELPDTWYQVAWPRDVEVDGIVAFLRSVAGDRRRHVVVFEVVGSSGAVSYRIGCSPTGWVRTVATGLMRLWSGRAELLWWSSCRRGQSAVISVTAARAEASSTMLLWAA